MKLVMKFLPILYIFLLGGGFYSHANSIPENGNNHALFADAGFINDTSEDDPDSHIAKSSGSSIEKAASKLEITENEDKEEEYLAYAKCGQIKHFFISDFYLHQRIGYFQHYIKNHLRLFKHFSNHSFKSLGIKFCVFRI